MTDRQNRPGGTYGAGMMMSRTDENLQRKSRQKRLILESMDLTKDPYFFKNHIGTFECRLCLTLHTTEGSYLAHTQAKKHRQNVERQKEREMRENNGSVPQPSKIKPANQNLIKIGLPGYRLKKMFDSELGQFVLDFEVEYKAIIEDQKPACRIVNAFEQQIEVPDERYLYLLFAADPYDTICFKIPNKKIDNSSGKFVQIWNKKKKLFHVTITYV